MPDYLVTWTMDVAADTPEEAAQSARNVMLDPESIATVFDVSSGDKTYNVDLTCGTTVEKETGVETHVHEGGGDFCNTCGDRLGA